MSDMGEEPGRSRRVVAAWALAAVDVVVTAAVVVLDRAGAVDLPLSNVDAYVQLVLAASLPSLGALLLRHAPRNRLGPVYLALGTASSASIAVHAYAQQGLVVQPGSLPAALAAAWVSQWLWVLVGPLLVLGVLWFPTGRVPSPRWRLAQALPVAAGAFLLASQVLRPGVLDNHPVRDNPTGWASPGVDAVYAAGQVALGLAGVAALASVAWRMRTGSALERRQLRWVLLTASVLAVTAVIPQDGDLAGAATAATVVAVPLVPLAIAVALVRHAALGVELVLRRSLVFGVLSVLLLVAYVGVVAGVTALLGARADRGATIAAAGVVAALAAPLRTRLQRSIDQLVYGDRGNPYAALTALGRRAAAAAGPEELLRETVEAVALALRAPYAAVVLRDDDAPAAETGTRSGPEHELPLEVHGDRVGTLVVAQRTPREAFAPNDLALLADLGRHVSVAARAAALSRDLQRSRERLVTAREEERRRIRRDLHDGLGPALAGITFGLDAARNVLVHDAAAADRMLEELKAEVSACLTDVRRLVYDLRPPALDQLGLVAAVEQYAARLSESGGLAVAVSARELPPLPAAVEVAAYRIATEALTNSARHSGGRRTSVSIALDGGDLRLEVADDGTGIGERPPAGVGLAAMAERAAELGGTCVVVPRQPRGTSVVAVLPVREAA